jgi:hypothetical protein
MQKLTIAAGPGEGCQLLHVCDAQLGKPQRSSTGLLGFAPSRGIRTRPVRSFNESLTFGLRQASEETGRASIWACAPAGAVAGRSTTTATTSAPTTNAAPTMNPRW